ncbi:hypothetical protein BO82DRAFT_431110 [Aspergillus uvarum CBS 121591]|uniref:F-box domain-containing protein n=1 Tax=Aspergillus uvarum CBS 121591 TaxID=1448315 RepID=A0A319CW05_9EURO|nr:hypothetical protein BO82DRAFT_431110 [Aspergillus uvarum CBS 121591]PYH83063.1 hypothetical protein BO82DRAFT_431110 [Aspergillus uvarum CBS 121591]
MNPDEDSPTPRPIANLPPELHLLIATHLPQLPDLSRAHLAQTNYYFHTLLPRPTHADLLAAELDPLAIANDLYACRYCLRLRRVTHFADRMVRRGRGRFGAARERAKRFCLECGICPRDQGLGNGGVGEGAGQAQAQTEVQAQAEGKAWGEARYGYGDLVRVQGEWRVFCGRCRGLRRVVPLSQPAASGKGRGSRGHPPKLQVWEEEQGMGMRLGRDLGCEGCLSVSRQGLGG